MKYFVYILECSDGTYYCGYTQDLDRRVDSHNKSKTGAKYTRSRRPIKLVYSETLPSKSTALKREFEIKRLQRDKKIQLIHNIN